MTGPKLLKRPWLPHDIARMLQMRDVEEKTWREIDVALGRTHGGSQIKYRALKAGAAPKMGSVGGGRVVLSPDQEVNLRARKDAENRMSMTATFFGDPPPGYSALDRRGRDTR